MGTRCQWYLPPPEARQENAPKQCRRTIRLRWGSTVSQTQLLHPDTNNGQFFGFLYPGHFKLLRHECINRFLNLGLAIEPA